MLCIFSFMLPFQFSSSVNFSGLGTRMFHTFVYFDENNRPIWWYSQFGCDCVCASGEKVDSLYNMFTILLFILHFCIPVLAVLCIFLTKGSRFSLLFPKISPSRVLPCTSNPSLVKDDLGVVLTWMELTFALAVIQSHFSGFSPTEAVRVSLAATSSMEDSWLLQQYGISVF